MAHDIFISYSSHDKPIADAVVAGLESQGIRCWVAPRDILPGSSWGEAIIGAIEGCRIMVIILSKHSNHSSQVVREVERAVSNNVIIIPFRIEKIDPTGAMAYFLATEHWLDAITPPIEAHIQKLAQTIQLFQNQGDGWVDPDKGPEVRTQPRQQKSRLALLISLGGLILVVALLLFVYPGWIRTAVKVSEKSAHEFLKIGEFRSAGSVMGLCAADEHMLYLASSTEGIKALSILDPANPVQKSHYPAEQAQDLAVAEFVAYVVQGEFERNLNCFPMDDPAQSITLPADSGSSDLTTSLYNVTIADGLLHLSGHNFWGIYDIASPLSPEHRLTWQPPEHSGNPCTVAVEGQTAYVGAGWAGLFVFDIHNAAKPVLLGQYQPSDWVIDVAVSANTAYLTLGDGGLLALDVSNPEKPLLLSLLALPGFASDIAVSQDYAFVLYGLNESTTQYQSGIAAVRLAESVALELVSQYDQLYDANDLYADGETVYIADEPYGLVVLQLG